MNRRTALTEIIHRTAGIIRQYQYLATETIRQAQAEQQDAVDGLIALGVPEDVVISLLREATVNSGREADEVDAKLTIRNFHLLRNQLNAEDVERGLQFDAMATVKLYLYGYTTSEIYGIRTGKLPQDYRPGRQGRDIA